VLISCMEIPAATECSLVPLSPILKVQADESQPGP
jgi:hypothetical protein